MSNQTRESDFYSQILSDIEDRLDCGSGISQSHGETYHAFGPIKLDFLAHRADTIDISSAHGGRSWANVPRWPFLFLASDHVESMTKAISYMRRLLKSYNICTDRGINSMWGIINPQRWEK